MARYAPPLVLIAMSILIWMLWKQNVYPFTELVFTHDGYGIHLIGGIGWAALQVWSTYVFLPEMPITPRFFTAHALIATGMLMLRELLQYIDETRQVQAGDILWQTIGVLFALLLLWQIERKRSTS